MLPAFAVVAGTPTFDARTRRLREYIKLTRLAKLQISRIYYLYDCQGRGESEKVYTIYITLLELDEMIVLQTICAAHLGHIKTICFLIGMHYAVVYTRVQFCYLFGYSLLLLLLLL